MVLTGPRAPIRLTSYETLKWSALGSVNDSIVPVHFASILRWSHLSRFYCEIVPAVVLFSAGPSGTSRRERDLLEKAANLAGDVVIDAKFGKEDTEEARAFLMDFIRKQKAKL